ncbi:MAG: hypothetical protein M1821_002282 [Bathelium mastoideum]|nr:MAG: hypothetical protein M1821_002282 [Bathelium mastoideum]
MPSAAASRPATRKSSRTASPAVRPSVDANPSSHGIQKEQATKNPGKFVEPPLLPPQPSYVDDRVPQQAVTSQMQPLGTRPSKKSKTKATLPGPSGLSQSVSALAAVEEGTPDTTPPVEIARPESRKSEHGATKRTFEEVEDDDDSTDEDEEEEEIVPQTQQGGPSRVTRSVAALQGILQRVPLDGRSVESRRALSIIIEKCVTTANEAGLPAIALAMQRMFEISEVDPNYHNCLCNIMSQKPTSEDGWLFQTTISIAKKELRKQEKQANKKRRIGDDANANDFSTRIPPQTGKTSPVKVNKGPEFAEADKVGTHTTNGDVNTMKAGVSLPPKQGERSGSSPLSSTHSDNADIAEVTSGLGSAPPTRPIAEPKSRKNAAPSKKKATTAKNKNKKAVTKSHKRRQEVFDVRYESDGFESEREAKKAKLLQKFDDDFPESHVRESVYEGKLSTDEGPGEGLSRTPFLSERPNQHPITNKVQLQPGRRSSRQVTPTTTNRTARVSKAARVKISPEKKKSGGPAGMGRVVGGGRESPLGKDERDETSSQNDDECDVCGGGGYLLCCDGCYRAFHFSCLQPPRQENDPMFDEPWFCCKCDALQDASATPSRGLFSELLQLNESENGKMFALPHGVIDHFEGVTVGAHGEYKDVVKRKRLEKSRTGYDVGPDYHKLRDKDGKLITCWQCHLSALDGRPIIPCDKAGCGLYWHLDCLDPPLAHPPAGQDNIEWHCPVHVEHDLGAVPVAKLVDEGAGSRTIRRRRPKDPTIVDTHLRRGFANNGQIEVDMDEWTDAEDEFYTQPGTNGRIHRLPQKGIILDFISKVKSTWPENAKYIGRDALPPSIKPSWQKRPGTLPSEKAAAPYSAPYSAPPATSSAAGPSQPPPARNMRNSPDTISSHDSSPAPEAPELPQTQPAPEARNFSYEEGQAALALALMSGETAGPVDQAPELASLTTALIAGQPSFTEGQKMKLRSLRDFINQALSADDNAE